MLRVLSPTFKLVLQQIRLLHVARILFSDWIKLRRSHAIHRILRHLSQNKFVLGR